MQVIHLHWRALPAFYPHGELIVWAEDATLPAPKLRREQAVKHPFANMPPALLQLLAEVGLSKFFVRSATLNLNLPSGSYGPYPSSELQHDWDLGAGDAMPELSPWRISGLSLSPTQGLSFLIAWLNRGSLPPPLVAGSDCLYWLAVTQFVLEILSQEKFKRPNRSRTIVPVLDSPNDKARLTYLQEALPSLCQAEADVPEKQRSAQSLLQTFINTMTNVMAGQWYQGAYSGLWGMVREKTYGMILNRLEQHPAALNVQPHLFHLHRHYNTWYQHHSGADNQDFRVALRLEAPDKPVATAEDKAWRLHYALQSRPDPTLLIPAEQVWQGKNNPLKRFSRHFKEREKQFLTGLHDAALFFAPLKPGMQQNNRPVSVALATPEAYDFLRRAAPLLKTSDFGVLVPAWWTSSTAELKVRLKMSPANGDGTAAESKVGFGSLIHYQWQLSVGQTDLTETEFKALVALKSPLMQLEGRWVQLDPRQVEAALQFWEKQQLEADVNLTEAMRLGLGLSDTTHGLNISQVKYEGWVADWMAKVSGR